MKSFEAVTASGTIYRYNNGVVIIATDPARAEAPYAFEPRVFRAVDRTKLPNGLAGVKVIMDQPVTELPVVGLSLYVEGDNDWRLSTPIIRVKELTE